MGKRYAHNSTLKVDPAKRLKPGKPMNRGNGWQGKPRVKLKPRSAKRIAEDRVLYGPVYREVRERSGGVCEKCHQRRAVHMHHLQPLGRGGDRVDPANIEHECDVCHRERHASNDLESGHKPIAASPLLAMAL